MSLAICCTKSATTGHLIQDQGCLPEDSSHKTAGAISLPLNWYMETQIHFLGSLWGKSSFIQVSLTTWHSVLIPTVHYSLLMGELSLKILLMIPGKLEQGCSKPTQSKLTKGQKKVLTWAELRWLSHMAAPTLILKRGGKTGRKRIYVLRPFSVTLTKALFCDYVYQRQSLMETFRNNSVSTALNYSWPVQTNS